jgi:2-C-methyl-D-erythritol 4-phosphate cytidylyltransferase
VLDAASALVIHDAARPLAAPALFDRCIERLEHWRCDGVVAAARAVDTVKEADAGGRVIATLERGTLWVVQTPQVFQADSLLRGLREGDLSRATDDAQLVEAVLGDIRVVEAPRHNLKVTTEQDLRIAELLIAGS